MTDPGDLPGVDDVAEAVVWFGDTDAELDVREPTDDRARIDAGAVLFLLALLAIAIAAIALSTGGLF